MEDLKAPLTVAHRPSPLVSTAAAHDAHGSLCLAAFLMSLPLLTPRDDVEARGREGVREGWGLPLPNPWDDGMAWVTVVSDRLMWDLLRIPLPAQALVGWEDR